MSKIDREIKSMMDVYHPRIVTYKELRRKLLPLCHGFKWGEDTIRDLWLMGAPVPNPGGKEEARILLPSQFKKWFDDVAYRVGKAIENIMNVEES